MPDSRLHAQQLFEDPRVAQAKRLLLDAVADHQSSLKSIRPPDPERQQHYAQLLKSFAAFRGNPLWFPYIGSGIGNGALVELLDGSVKYDFISGIGVHHFGHSHRDLIDAAVDGAISNTIMQGNLQQNRDSLDLALQLCKAANMDHCFLTTSGAMANENGLKIAFQKRAPANRILAFSHCFAGRTTTLAQITDKPAYREGLPSNLFVDYLPFYDHERPEESTSEAIRILKEHLNRHPKGYAAMIFEPVLGEGGCCPGSHDFFAPLLTLLKEHGVSVFADEVQTFGRTGSLFAFQHFGLEEYVDIVSIGKLSQVCATLFKKDHCPKPTLLSQTFTGSTVSIRAANVILKQLMEQDFYGPEGKNARLFQEVSSSLQDIAERHPNLLRGPFGIGCMIAFTVFDGDYNRTCHFIQKLFEAGVMSFLAGTHPTRVRFLLPAGAVTSADIDAVSRIIEDTLKQCEGAPCT